MAVKTSKFLAFIGIVVIVIQAVVMTFLVRANADAPKHLSVEQLEIVDKHGNPSIRLGTDDDGSVSCLIGANDSANSIELSVSNDGVATIQLAGKKAVISETSSPSLGRVDIVNSEQAGATIVFANEGTRAKTSMGVFEGAPAINVSTDLSSIDIRASDKDATLTLKGSGESIETSLGVLSSNSFMNLSNGANFQHFLCSETGSWSTSSDNAPPK